MVDDDMLNEHAKYGFRWGPAAIWRIMKHRDRLIVGITTRRRHLEIAISPKGDSIKVYLDGKEMKVSG